MKNLKSKFKDNLVQKPFETMVKLAGITGGIVGPLANLETIQNADNLESLAYIFMTSTIGTIAGFLAGIPLGIVNYMITNKKRQELKTVFITELKNGYRMNELLPIDIKYSQEQVPKNKFDVFGGEKILYKKLEDYFLVYEPKKVIADDDINLSISTNEEEAKNKCLDYLIKTYDINLKKEAYIERNNSGKWKKFKP